MSHLFARTVKREIENHESEFVLVNTDYKLMIP